MNVLLIGSGGREHALAWKISQSPVLRTLYVAPGNPGIAEVATCVALDAGDFPAVTDFCRDKRIGLVAIGPEGPLVAGLADALAAQGIRVFGPSQAAARLEGSKGFMKDFCREHGIPTAAYARFSDATAARRHLDGVTYPIVIKADGLAAGKGVVVAGTPAEAIAAVEACFQGAFGIAGAEIVIEAFLVGEEASFFVISDGITVLPFGTAQDHKRLGDGDTGPNTGGMGAYSPAPVMSPDVVERTMAGIIRPTIQGMAAKGTPFQGVLYAGLMIADHRPHLIEYNVRFGDPECQALMMRLESDLLPILTATAEGRLDEVTLAWSPEPALVVVLAAEGYPGPPKKGTEIGGLESAAEVAGVRVFQAGTRRLEDGSLVADGGRVLNVAVRAPTLAHARAAAYEAASRIAWPGGFYRRDIGWRALARPHKIP